MSRDELQDLCILGFVICMHFAHSQESCQATWEGTLAHETTNWHQRIDHPGIQVCWMWTMLSKKLKGNDDAGLPEDMSMYLNCLSIESFMGISSACRFMGAEWILLLPLSKTRRQRRRFLRGVDIPSYKQSCVGKTSRISLACLSWATHYTGEREGGTRVLLLHENTEL